MHKVNRGPCIPLERDGIFVISGMTVGCFVRLGEALEDAPKRVAYTRHHGEQVSKLLIDVFLRRKAGNPRLGVAVENANNVILLEMQLEDVFRFWFGIDGVSGR